MIKFLYKKDSEKTEISFHANFEVFISAVFGSTGLFEVIRQVLMNI